MADKQIHELNALSRAPTSTDVFAVDTGATTFKVSYDTLSSNIVAAAQNGIVANTYSTSTSYAVGDYCTRNGVLYRCVTAIPTGESWTSSHWTAVTIGADVSTIANDLSDLEDTVDGKVDISQGSANAGKPLVVGSNGNVTIGDAPITDVVRYGEAQSLTAAQRSTARINIDAFSTSDFKTYTGSIFEIQNMPAGGEVTSFGEATYVVAMNNAATLCTTPYVSEQVSTGITFTTFEGKAHYSGTYIGERTNTGVYFKGGCLSTAESLKDFDILIPQDGYSYTISAYCDGLTANQAMNLRTTYVNNGTTTRYYNEDMTAASPYVTHTFTASELSELPAGMGVGLYIFFATNEKTANATVWVVVSREPGVSKYLSASGADTSIPAYSPCQIIADSSVSVYAISPFDVLQKTVRYDVAQTLTTGQEEQARDNIGAKVDISQYVGKKISIIGDSISTYDAAGYKIDGYRMYFPTGDVTSPEKTWWWQVINAYGGMLEVNASWSGSCASTIRSSEGYPDFYDRCGLLGSPDVVFVQLGTNDSSYQAPLGEYDYTTEYTSLSEANFRTAYIKGLKALQANYPGVEIVIIILYISRDEYTESIRSIAQTMGLKVVEKQDYTRGSGVHPNAVGMTQIADAILATAEDAITTGDLVADAAATGQSLSRLKNNAQAMVAPAYSTSGTYAVGDYVTYDDKLYRCVTAISTAEAWTAAHWTVVSVGGDLASLASEVSSMSCTVSSHTLVIAL